MWRRLIDFDVVGSRGPLSKVRSGIYSAVTTERPHCGEELAMVKRRKVTTVPRCAVAGLGQTLAAARSESRETVSVPLEEGDSARPATKKTVAKKAAAKETAVKKTAVKKAAVKKTAVKETAVKKAAAKKSAAKKTVAKELAVSPSAEVQPHSQPSKDDADAKTNSLFERDELSRIRADLQAEHDRLVAEVVTIETNIAEVLRDSGDGTGDDQADTGSKAFERDHAMTVLVTTLQAQEQTEHALERIDGGRYGLCESCGQPISKERLVVFPRATVCVQCKRVQERG